MSRKTEKFGRRAIEEFIDSSEILDSYFFVNDKTPSWDGDIFVYENPPKGNRDLSKDSFNRRIPIQIKGITVRNAKKGITEFKFDISDIRSYYNDNGVILFVVEKDSDGNQSIFYRDLLPWDLKEILKTNIEGKVKIKLLFISKKDILRFEDIIENFLLNRKKQTSVVDFEVLRDKVKILEIPFVLRNNDPISYMLNNEVYLYGKYHEDDLVPLVIEKIKAEKITERKNVEIAIDDEIYFNYLEIEHVSGIDIAYYEDCIKLYKNQENLKITIMGNLDIDKQIKSLNFLIGIITKKHLTIDNKSIDIPVDFEINQTLYDLKQRVKSLNDIVTLLDIFKIEHSKLDINKLNNEDIVKLNGLISIMVYKNDAKEFAGIPGRFRIRVGNISLLLLIYITDKGEIKYLNYDDIDNRQMRLSLKADDGTHVVVSKYLALDKEEIIEFDNIRLEEFYGDITSFEYSNYYNSAVTNFILRLISVYDNTNIEGYLDVSLKLIGWLEKYDSNSPVNKINCLQVKYRKKELSKYDFNYLKQMIEDEKEYDNYNTLLCCIYILLDEDDKFNEIFGKLTVNQRKNFCDFPIYKLKDTIYIKNN